MDPMSRTLVCPECQKSDLYFIVEFLRCQHCDILLRVVLELGVPTVTEARWE